MSGRAAWAAKRMGRRLAFVLGRRPGGWQTSPLGISPARRVRIWDAAEGIQCSKFVTIIDPLEVPKVKQAVQ